MPTRHHKHKQNKGLKVGLQILIGVVCVVLLSILAWHNETIKSRMISTFGNTAKYQKEEYEKQKEIAAKKYGSSKAMVQVQKNTTSSKQEKYSESSKESSKTADRYITYTVRSGDSLTVIANRYGTSVQELIKINDLPETGRVATGEELKIPVTSQTSSTSEAQTTAATESSESSAQTADE